jgi:NACHT domain
MRNLDDMAWLDRLAHAKDASHLAGNRRRCVPGTRTYLLQAIEAWITDPDGLNAYWLNGMAGTGKSTIAQSVAERTLEIWLLGGSFFCSSDFIDRRELSNIFPTLAFQLACRYPEFRYHLIDAIKSTPDIARHSLSDQFDKLLFRPLKASGLKTVIIIDALDECIDNEPASAILSVLSQYIDQLPLVKFFITGRPERRTDSGFRLPSLRPHTETMILHKIEPTLVDRDIATYFKTRFLELRIRTDLGSVEGWPGEDAITTLVRKSSRLFIYAETTFRFIDSNHRNPKKQLIS